MKKYIAAITLAVGIAGSTTAQEVRFGKFSFEPHNVAASVVRFQGAKVLKVERDFSLLPFDSTRLESTVDEPTYLKLKGNVFKNGIIEVKMWSQIQEPTPFRQARGFIGIAFRIAAGDTAFESVYLRPQNGRARSQFVRNHTVQYFSYPHYKFNKLRRDHPGEYETWAPVSLGEWITMRLEVRGSQLEMFVNDEKHSGFVVDKMKGDVRDGAIGLWVDVGTTAYFKDLKIVSYD